MKNGMDRRTLLKRGAGLLAASWVLPRIGLKAASERINVASIGIADRSDTGFLTCHTSNHVRLSRSNSICEPSMDDGSSSVT